MLERLQQRLLDLLWNTDADGRPWWQRSALYAARIVHNVARDMAGGQLTLRAMSLVYTTLLSLVPLLALSFSVLKAFGVHHRFEPLLLNLMAPLGARGDEIAVNIIAFIENMRVGVLGSIGLALLIYTVITLVQKVENSFNYIWKIRHARTLSERFSDYLSVILIGPLLVITALGISASAMSTTVMQRVAEIEPFGSGIYFASLLAPYVMAWAAFTFTYSYITNTRVRFHAAAGGGLVAALLWKSVGYVFASFAAGSTRFDAVYSSFAILILLLIWVYLTWLVLLIGSQVAFYLQHPRFVSRESQDRPRAEAENEALALSIMYWVGHNFMRRLPPWTLEDLADRMGVPSYRLGDLVEKLIARDLLVETRRQHTGFQPGRDPADMGLQEILDCIRQPDTDLPTKKLPPPVADAYSAIEGAISQSLKGRTLRDLLAAK